MGLNQAGESSWCLQAEIWHGAARNIYEKKLLSMWWVCWEGIKDEGGVEGGSKVLLEQVPLNFSFETSS